MIPRYIMNFDTHNLRHKETEFLVIGSGIAGLYTALKASNFAQVTILTKKKIGDTNTERAQGGIAAAIHSADSPLLHRADTLEAGAGLCNVGAVEVLVNEGPDRVRELIRLGANFDRYEGELAFAREAAHSRRRILHAGDSTGEEIQNTLARTLLNDQKVEFLENHMVIDLLTDNGKCLGALIFDSVSKEVFVYYSKAVILATGGAGQVFRNTTNPEVATGDGMAMAFRAGAKVMDAEFVQFHPTALCIPGAPRFLISEAVRGEGAVLRNIHGEKFMTKYHPGAELASRDIVARAIINEMLATGSDHVYLDLSPMAGFKVKKRFPTISRTCLKYGIDITKEMIPVAPAAHYMMGGVYTNLNGETSIKNLFACGEVACPGVHGANRLASNSLLDGLVFGHRIVEYYQHIRNVKEIPEKKNFRNNQLQPSNPELTHKVRQRVQDLMWESVGIIRDELGLKAALDEICVLEKVFRNQAHDIESIETYNILTVSKFITAAALTRKESRGAHYLKEYEIKDDVNWKKHIVLYRNDRGDICVSEHELS